MSDKETMLHTLADIRNFTALLDKRGPGNASHNDIANVLHLLERVVQVVVNKLE